MWQNTILLLRWVFFKLIINLHILQNKHNCVKMLGPVGAVITNCFNVYLTMWFRYNKEYCLMILLQHSFVFFI